MSKSGSIALALLAFFFGVELQVRWDRHKIKVIQANHKYEMEDMRSEGFHAGYRAAEESPTVRFNHYGEFVKWNKGLLRE